MATAANPPAEGKRAPAFTLPDQNGDKVRLSALQGRRVLVYFYPKADTAGCTTQACGLRDVADQIGDTAIIGVSPCILLQPILFGAAAQGPLVIFAAASGSDASICFASSFNCSTAFSSSGCSAFSFSAIFSRASFSFSVNQVGRRIGLSL